MNFDHDIFVSYAHLDNQAPFEGEQGWIANFSRALKIRVGQLIGRDPKLWRDPQLHGNDEFAEVLTEKVSKVATLVTILTPRYIKSDWCLKELETFWEAANSTNGVKINGKSRIFKVLKTPISPDMHPGNLKGFIGYKFFETDPQTGRERELDQVFGPEAQRKLWSQIDDLAHDIHELLQSLYTTHEPSDNSATVFLAETSFDLQDQYDAIKRDLHRHGHTVLPEESPPTVINEFEKFIKNQLDRCEYSVHLIGQNYGMVPDGAVESIVATQYEFAIQQNREDFYQLIWIAPNLNINDDRQRNFIEHLKNDSRIGQYTDLLESSLEDLKNVLHRKLKQKIDPVRVSTGNAADILKIYLICNELDLEHIGPIEDYLFDNGYEVITPVFDGDEAEIRQLHEDYLRECDAAIIYYGAGNELWQRRKVNELRKIAGQGRLKPFLENCIYIAPPDTPQKKRLRRIYGAEIIRQNTEGFNSDELKAYLTKLTRNKVERSD